MIRIIYSYYITNEHLMPLDVTTLLFYFIFTVVFLALLFFRVVLGVARTLLCSILIELNMSLRCIHTENPRRDLEAMASYHRVQDSPETFLWIHFTFPQLLKCFHP